MTLIYEHATPGAATHALIIGVGSYSCLPGGKSKKTYPKAGTLGQLSSPPHSARQFVNWLLTKYCNPKQQLSTVELLISDDSKNTFDLPNGYQKAVERATIDRTEKAINRWFERGHTNADHLMIFYFCGHGVSSGDVNALLMEDFGSNINNPMRASVDFETFFGGMDKCKSRNQIYFIDSCRVADRSLILENIKGFGIAVLSEAGDFQLVPRCTARYYAAVPGQRAYGRENMPSVFTEALLSAMQGAGCRGYPGEWEVFTDSLELGLRQLIHRADLDSQTRADIDAHTAGSFSFHRLMEDLSIPVTLGCVPSEANLVADLGYIAEDGQKQPRPAPDLSDWELMIPPGDYDFFAEFRGANYTDKKIHVYVNPPGQPYPLKVQP
jgi:hypothetical protein